MRYYDKQGNPMELDAWAHKLDDREYKVVEQTHLKSGDVLVSTVWLGIDHNFLGEGPPLIFETMVFGDGEDDYTERYSTEEQARAGHVRIVAELRGEQNVR